MARSRGLIWAMEELEEKEAVAVVEEPMAVDSLETDMLDVNEQAADIEDANTAIEEAVEDVETLEDIASVMDQSTENGGMDSVSARVAEVAVESIYSRLGVVKKAAMPAMESFGKTSTRLTATKLAVENVKEFVKAAWEKIVKAATTVWNWIKGFFASIFNTAAKLKDRAAALLVRVKSYFGKKPSETKVDLGNVGARIAYDGKVDFDSVMQGLKHAEDMAKNAVAAAEKLASDVVTADDAKAAEDEGAVAQVKTSDIALPGFTKTEETQEDTQIMESGQLPGGDTISIEVPKPGLQGEAAIKAKGRLKVDKHANKRKRKVAKEEHAEVIDVEAKFVEPEKLAEAVEKVGLLAKMMEAAKSGMGKITSAGSSFLSILKSIGNKAVDGAKAVGGYLQRAFAAVSRAVSGFVSKVYSAVVTSGKSILDWVEKHLQAYKDKKANKENGITELKAA